MPNLLGGDGNKEEGDWRELNGGRENMIEQNELRIENINNKYGNWRQST